MNYEQKYKEALERMKSWVRGEHPECFCEAQKAAEFIFPELKESDEKVREDIISLVNEFWERIGSINPEYSSRSRMLDWLEKQGEQKQAKQPYSYELEEEIEEWLGCEAFPEGTNITPLPKAMEIVRETANHFYDFGRKQQSVRNIQCTNSQVITPESYINEGQKKGIQIVLDNPQEYGLQKSTDKVEPKFKVGDWIVQNDNGTVSQITKVINGIDKYGEYRAYEHTNGYFAECFENEYHLWTINDAKDGDVLVDEVVNKFRQDFGL